jgi:hypothetical protein
VEVHVIDGYAVYVCLRLGKAGEDHQRPFSYPIGESTAVQQLPDAAPGAVRRFVDERLNVDLHGAHAGAGHRSIDDADSVGDDRVDRPPHRVPARAGIHQSTEKHVTGDARGGVDPGVPVSGAHVHPRPPPAARRPPPAARRPPRALPCGRSGRGVPPGHGWSPVTGAAICATS